MRQLVFVYGTLMRGERNHTYLRHSQRLGHWRTPPLFSLYSLVSYPVACAGGRQVLQGEIYRISAETFAQLDALEEYPRVYTRERLNTPWGPAWVYLQRRPPPRATLIPSGRWRRRNSRPLQRAGFEPVDRVQPDRS